MRYHGFVSTDKVTDHSPDRCAWVQICPTRGPDWPKNMRGFVNCTPACVQSNSVVAERSRVFENNDMIVHLFLRPSDQRARVLCRSLRSSRPTLCCLPLSALKAIRSESCIQLRKPSLSGRTADLWANLRFTTYERESLANLVEY